MEQGKFRDTAVAAYEEQKRRQAEADAEREAEDTAQYAAMFEKDYGFKPDNAAHRTVTIDGVTLRPYFYQSYANNHDWTVAGICSQCGAPVLSSPCRSLSEIGQMIASFKPDYSHYCSTPSSVNTPTLGEQLTDLIRQIAADVTQAA